jgi:hypothetical protein
MAEQRPDTHHASVPGCQCPASAVDTMPGPCGLPLVSVSPDVSPFIGPCGLRPPISSLAGDTDSSASRTGAPGNFTRPTRAKVPLVHQGDPLISSLAVGTDSFFARKPVIHSFVALNPGGWPLRALGGGRGVGHG